MTKVTSLRDAVRNEPYSFEYDDNWLKNTNTFLLLDPDLAPEKGRQFPTENHIFGVFQDASPDRWGSVLMNKKGKNTC